MNDRDILRTLATEYATRSHSAENRTVKNRYADLNSLRPVKPIVLIDEIPWHEFADLDEMRIQCADSFAQEMETFFRRKLFQHKHFRGDLYLEPYYPLYRQVRVDSLGIEKEEDVLRTDAAGGIASHSYHDQLGSDEDLSKLREPVVHHDAEHEAKLRARAEELLGDTLPVRPAGRTLHFHPWDTISEWRGVQNLLIDLIDRPEFCHRLMETMTRIYLSIVAQYEELDLLEPNPPRVHCTAGFADDLVPANGHVTRANIWGRGAAQIFGEVSREMLEEFDLSYQRRYMDGFGLVYYGCCEPLHTKIDLVEKLPNLRKISITPWADVDEAAECMAGRYVLSRKPNPANVAITVDHDIVEDEIRGTLEACKRNNLVCEFVLKDISTVGGRVENLVAWEQTAMRTIDAFG